MPRPVTLVSLAILAGAGVAVVDAQSPYALPETPVTSAAFALPSTAKCIKSPYVVVLKVAAPSGASFNSITASVDGRQSTRVVGATTESRHQIYIGPGTSEVAIESTTPGGQSVSVSRSLKACAQPKPKPKRKATKKPSNGGGNTGGGTDKPKPIPTSPVTEGGGED